MRCERANPDAKNFGLLSRDMGKAGLNALKEDMQSRGSIATMSDRFNQFASYARSELNIRDMRQLERSHVQQYAEHLKERFEGGEINAATAQNYLSAVNRVMEIARGDQALRVEPVRQAGLPQRSGICTESHAVPQEKHEQAISQVSDRLAAQMELQRALGLRFEESCKMDATRALSQAMLRGAVSVSEGTKGGRDRIVPVTSERQIQALKNASEIQGDHRSLIPSNQTYREYQQQCYRESPIPFHGERHTYAHDRYQGITGQPCPVSAGIEHGKAHQSDQEGCDQGKDY